MNILVVDDNKSVRDSLFNVLTQIGYDVECAVNGLDALEKVKSSSHQLCIVDHLMPLMNGVQLTKNLKQNEQYKNIPIIFMTTQGSDAVKLLPECQLFYAVINKPLEQDQLLTLISQLRPVKLSDEMIAVNE